MKKMIDIELPRLVKVYGGKVEMEKNNMSITERMCLWVGSKNILTG